MPSVLVRNDNKICVDPLQKHLELGFRIVHMPINLPNEYKISIAEKQFYATNVIKHLDMANAYQYSYVLLHSSMIHEARVTTRLSFLLINS